MISPEYIQQGLVQRGLPAHIAQGFVMNMQDESGLNPGINEVAPTVQGSRGGYGLYQLTGPRRVAYESYAQRRGVALDDADAQLDFLMSELGSTEKRAAQSIFSTENPQDAAVAIARDFLRPSASNLEKRVNRYRGSSSMMQQEEKPRGLLGSLGIQRMEEGAAGETGERFYERDTFKDTAAILAQGFAAMGSRPGLQKVAADVAAQRTEGRAKNRTIDYLRKAGRDDLAGAVESGALGVRDAAKVLFTQPKDNSTALQKNYQFFISQGMSPEEAMQAVRSGTVINMPDQKGADEFAKLDAKNLASVAEVGMSASRSLAQINRLEQLLSNTQTGAAGALKMFAGNFGINSEGLDDIQAAQAIINSLVPQQRPAGSGPMSDADLELFKQSLPRIINTPQGNTTILETMRGIAQYDAMGAEIIQKYRSDPEFTQADAFAALAARPDPFEAVRPIMTATNSETMSREDALDLLNQ